MAENQVKLAEKDVDYIPFGAEDKIKLSIAIIQKYVAEPTKSGKTCSDRDALRFMMLCQAKRLNPFEGDAFLLGYDCKDNTAKFSLITAQQVFLKRAEASPQFDGMQSGVIIFDKDNVMQEREGDFVNEDEILVGAWCKVFRKDRRIPFYKRLHIAVFDTKQSRWEKDPAGMIVKCAESDALRSAFPTHLGGLYTHEEMENVEIRAAVVESAGKSSTNIPKEVEQATASAALKLEVLTDGKEASPATTPQKQIETLMTSAGLTFVDWVKWASANGHLKDADSLPSFDEVPKEVAVRLLRNPAGMVKAVLTIKEASAK